jgi:hypothetical protein
MKTFRSIVKKLLVVVCLLILLSCNKENVAPGDPSPEKCATEHFGTVTLNNITGQEIVYNFPNGQQMDCYGVIAIDSTKSVQNVSSGRIKVRCFYKLSDQVHEFNISVLDCQNTIIELR